MALEIGLEDLAVFLDAPRLDLFLGVLVLEMERPYTEDLAVFDVDGRRVAVPGERALTQALQNRLVPLRSHLSFCHPASSLFADLPRSRWTLSDGRLVESRSTLIQFRKKGTVQNHPFMQCT
jgi:hypothetical protein